jgi:D-beta-D-heptose 7-phosphate kinase/D-beta-D-heptose 1-phosphate adenosyltransferase
MKIFVNGTFDVLHPGHLDLLNYAKSLGDFLLVAIDSDSRVASKKGMDRPFNPQYNRMKLLENLKAVDEVVIFDTDQELTQTVKILRPDIMIVGSDYKDKTVIGSEYARELRFYSRTTPHSSTQILEHFIDRRRMYG